MISRIFQNKRLITLGLVMVMLFIISGVAFPANGGCERALALCWMDYWYMPDVAVAYCGTGYIFCKKYI